MTETEDEAMDGKGKRSMLTAHHKQQHRIEEKHASRCGKGSAQKPTPHRRAAGKWRAGRIDTVRTFAAGRPSSKGKNVIT